MPQRTDDPVISRTELLSQGLSDHQIRRARERGELHSVLPGLYLRSVPDPPADPAERHRATLTVVVPLLAGRPVVSHVSAAVIHGLPFCHSEIGRLGRPRHSEIGWLGRPRHDEIGRPRREDTGSPGGTRPSENPPIHITRSDATKSRRGAAVRLHKAALQPSEVVELGGLPVTTPERTVVDCALTMPFDHAVMLADAALHRRLVSRESLARQLDRLHRVPGTRRAEQVVAFADPRSDGPGESFSRVLMHRWGVPTPELDVQVTDVRGLPLGRVAFAFAQARVLGEFADHDSPPDADPDDRTVALQEAGWRMVRWSWPDLRTPEPWVDRCRPR
jgi:hypothetical protein